MLYLQYESSDKRSPTLWLPKPTLRKMKKEREGMNKESKGPNERF